MARYGRLLADAQWGNSFRHSRPAFLPEPLNPACRRSTSENHHSTPNFDRSLQKTLLFRQRNATISHAHPEEIPKEERREPRRASPTPSSLSPSFLPPLYWRTIRCLPFCYSRSASRPREDNLSTETPPSSTNHESPVTIH